LVGEVGAPQPVDELERAVVGDVESGETHCWASLRFASRPLDKYCLTHVKRCLIIICAGGVAALRRVEPELPTPRLSDLVRGRRPPSRPGASA
jgi:hypothetical protein